MQKSQQGLLQSLVYEILQECRQLIPAAFGSRWQAYDTLPHPTASWTRHELLQVLNSIMVQDHLPVRFCFFIDGLDEYDGDTE